MRNCKVKAEKFALYSEGTGKLLKVFYKSTLGVSPCSKPCSNFHLLPWKSQSPYSSYTGLCDPVLPTCQCYSPPGSLLQLHWASHCSLDMTDMPQPQGLCMCYSLCLECFFPKYPYPYVGVGPEQSHRALCLKGPVLGLMLCH